jgi:hypothetical protein
VRSTRVSRPSECDSNRMVREGFFCALAFEVCGEGRGA